MKEDSARIMENISFDSVIGDRDQTNETIQIVSYRKRKMDGRFAVLICIDLLFLNVFINSMYNLNFFCMHACTARNIESVSMVLVLSEEVVAKVAVKAGTFCCTNKDEFIIPKYIFK